MTPSVILSAVDMSNGIECGIIEINMRKKKWILLGIYRPLSQSEIKWFDTLGKVLDTLTLNSGNFVVIGVFNTEESADSVSNFMNLYGLTNIGKAPTCFKALNARCFNLIQTNNAGCFKSRKTSKTGLSYFHSMTVTVVKSSFIKRCPKMITYRY